MKPNRLSLLALLLISMLIVGSKIKYPQKNIISSDNFGYYLYLPANFIYDDPGLKGDWYKTINEKYKNTPTLYQLMKSPKGGIIDRFFYGMSLIWSPAFFTGHTIAKNYGFEADGFSKPYQWALIIYGALFAILGVFISRKILLYFFSDTITAVTLLLMFIGTNIFFFSTIGNDIPHVYLYTLYALIIWFTIKWHEHYKLSYAIGLGIVAGITMSVRQSEMIAAIIPVLWGVTNYKTLVEKMNAWWKHRWQVITIAVLAILMVIPQLIYWRLFAGEYFINVYNDAGSTLNLSNPRFAYVLFGFRKGWFIYSPLSLLSFIGLIYCWKHHRTFFWPTILYLAVNIYLIASFTSLVSYGWRAFIQSYAVLLLPLGCFTAAVFQQKKFIRIIIGLLLIPFIILNIHQAWQTNMAVIDGSRMTRAYYFRIIGKNTVSEQDRSLLMVERSVTAKDSLLISPDLNQKPLLDLAFDNEKIKSGDSAAPTPYQGQGMFRMSKEVAFSPGIKTTYNAISNEYYFYLKASVYVYGYNEDIYEKLRLVITTTTVDKKELKYRAFSFKGADLKFIPGTWNKLSFDYLTPEVFTKEEIIQSYVWYAGEGVVWIDNFKIDAYTLD